MNARDRILKAIAEILEEAKPLIIDLLKQARKEQNERRRLSN